MQCALMHKVAMTQNNETSIESRRFIKNQNVQLFVSECILENAFCLFVYLSIHTFSVISMASLPYLSSNKQHAVDTDGIFCSLFHLFCFHELYKHCVYLKIKYHTHFWQVSKDLTVTSAE